MVHVRGIGESFGLACGELYICNKPLFTYGLSPQCAHLQILGNKTIIYNDPEELVELFHKFDRRWLSQQQWDMYSEHYNTKAVMQHF